MTDVSQRTPAKHNPDKPCIIRVVVRNCADLDGPPVHDKTGNHSERYFRDWIASTMYWAVRNNHQVTTYPDEGF